jgi:ATP-dependent protease ClpP protease subunit
MTVTVVPRSTSGVFANATLVYLDGPIDADAPDRLAKALDDVTGQATIWLNSPGGNLYAGMQLGRVIRKHGASTHIINSRTLLPGECYSACSLAFLGGIYRFADHGARYGVHRASIPDRPPTGTRDLAHDLSDAIESFIREMGVDARLFDLWVKAGPDEMYVLSRSEALNLGVVNDGRMPAEWSIAASPAGPRLQGRQTTIDGTGTVSFSCDAGKTILGATWEAAGKADASEARGWSHWLTIDSYQEVPLKAQEAASQDGTMRATFIVPTDFVRRARSARQIGLRLKPPGGRSPAIGYRVDVDDRSAAVVRSFLGDCLRGR